MDNRNNNNNINFSRDIKFVEKHIGGVNDDTNSNFNNQSNIITNNKSNYERMLDHFNKLDREKNKNDQYIERLDNEKFTTPYRVNNYATYVEDVNYSNPVVYPKEYDMYFDYLEKKNLNSINNQVVKKKTYINIDSSNRNIQTSLNIEKYIQLENNCLEFKDQQNYLKIKINNANKLFQLNDYIILRGFQNFNNYYQNLNFFFTNGSPVVILDLKPNFNLKVPYYDILVKITGVSNNNSSYWKNIPISLINELHKVYINVENNDYRLAFDLPINFYSDNELDKILVSNCEITFLNIGNYPINLINANTPITANNLSNYLIVNDITNNYIKILLTSNISINENINLEGEWINGSFSTGKDIQIGKIESIVEGYLNPNNYTIYLNKTYSNIVEIKIISSEIPNVQKNINVIDKNITSINSTTDVNLQYIAEKNNKLYWQNIDDIGIYSIELLPGFYSYLQLKQSIEELAAKVPRNLTIDNDYTNKYNLLTVNFNTDTNESEFNLFNLYDLPNCLENIFTIKDTPKENSFIIRINQLSHNLKVGDKIFIIDSTDYYFISKDYINSVQGHIIVKINNNNYFEINISNINKINDVGDTKGGYTLKIKQYAIFRMFFNFKDTFGSLIGFRLVGSEYSITNYASTLNNYTITNIQKYYYDISQIVIINGNITPFDINSDFASQTKRYILLLLDGFNVNNTPNGPSYFYKFLLNGEPNTYLYNSFVNTPVLMNPPIKSLNELRFTFINSNGGLVKFGNLEHSFTIELTTLSNLPENTNLTTYMSRI